MEDEADLEAAREVQAGLSLQGPEVDQPPAPAKRSDDWRAYFASADALLAANPPPATDLSVLRQIAPLGLGEGRFDPGAFTDAEGEAIAAGVARARGLARRGGLGGGRVIDGWSYPDADLGDFGENYAFRAQVAVSGLAAHRARSGGHFVAFHRRAIGDQRQRRPRLVTYGFVLAPSVAQAAVDSRENFLAGEVLYHLGSSIIAHRSGSSIHIRPDAFTAMRRIASELS